MCNGILHVNTKENIIVMMKIENNNFCQWLRKYNVQKMSQKPYSEFWGKKWHSKAQKVILSERFGAPCGEREISQGAIVIACATVLLWLEFFKNFRLPGRQFNNRIHLPDSKIHQPRAIGHDFLCTLSVLYQGDSRIIRENWHTWHCTCTFYIFVIFNGAID